MLLLLSMAGVDKGGGGRRFLSFMGHFMWIDHGLFNRNFYLKK